MTTQMSPGELQEWEGVQYDISLDDMVLSTHNDWSVKSESCEIPLSQLAPSSISSPGPMREQSAGDCGSSNGSDSNSTGSSRRAQTKTAWTDEEDRLIVEGVKKFGYKWSRLADTLPYARTDDSVRNRWHRISRRPEAKLSKPKPKRIGGRVRLSTGRVAGRPNRGSGGSSSHSSGVGTASFSDDEGDESTEEGKPREQGRHGDMWTAEEDRIIDTGVRVQRLKWRAIAEMLPGRTDSGCRNRWVRTQQRLLASAGTPVRGAAGVFLALRQSGMLNDPPPPAEEDSDSLGSPSAPNDIRHTHALWRQEALTMIEGQ